MKRLICTLLLTILLASSVSWADGSSADAENLSRRCVYTSTITRKYWQENITDGKLETHITFPQGAEIVIEWQSEIEARYLYWEWYELPSACSLFLYDGTGALKESVSLGGGFLNDAKEVSADIRKAVFIAYEEFDLSELRVYGEGVLPENYHPWEPEAERVDFLIVAMHPDDDALFLGGVMPIYGAEKGYAGTILYMATRTRLRCTEALNGAYLMGLRTYPILAGFPDIPSTMPQELKDTFTLEDVTEYLVGQFRKLKPLVVVSHDMEGEYGHWQHKLLAQATLDAAELAADPAYSPETAAEWGVWEVRKVYLHLYPENTMELPTDLPLAAFDGKTAFEIASLAYDCHESQQTGVHLISDDGEYGIRYFGLAYSTVGLDSGSNDMFENIDAALLSSSSSSSSPDATSTPALEQPSPALSETSLAPSEVAASPTPSPSPATATPSPAPVSSGADEGGSSTPLIWLILGALAALLTIGVVIVGIKSRRS
ncbi:MAG: PIG-L family deacetylase [Clostridia bacterium]|nr:PIG-L family deacetylase [Clostridia bacterium]